MTQNRFKLLVIFLAKIHVPMDRLVRTVSNLSADERVKSSMNMIFSHSAYSMRETRNKFPEVTLEVFEIWSSNLMAMREIRDKYEI